MRTVAVIIAEYRAEAWIGACMDAWRAVGASRGYEVDIRVGVDGCEATAAILWDHIMGKAWARWEEEHA